MRYVGDLVTIDYFLKGTNGQPADADVEIVVTAPDGSSPAASETHPDVGHFTFTWPTLDTGAGVYSFVITASGAVVDVTPGAVQILAAAARAWAPSAADVHALIPMRPEFTDTSRPTVAEVESLIAHAVDSLDAEVGLAFPVRFYGKARLLATLNAASLVEQNYFPEQQFGDDGPYGRLYQRYKDELVGLRSLLGDQDGSGPGSAFTAISPAEVAAARLHPELYP